MNTVAVILPVLNEEDVLPDLLQRIQSWGADEIIFVDGGSSDHTPQLLAASGVKWMHGRPGRAVQMNMGASEVQCSIFLFLHIDTVISSSCIESVKDAMNDPDVVGGRFDVQLSGRHPAFRMIEWFINWRSRITKISTGDQAMFVRRDVFRHLGGFLDIPLMEDVEFSRRLKRQGRITCLWQQVMTSSRRWEKHGIVRTILLMWWLRFRYWIGTNPAVLKRHYVDHS